MRHKRLGMPWSRCWLWGNPCYSVNPMRQFTPIQADMYKRMYIVPRARWLNSRFEQNAACQVVRNLA
jgi:hypothetical protein